METFLRGWELQERARKNSFYIIDPISTYVSADTEIGAGSTIYPGTFLHAGAKIGRNCIVYSGVHIFNSTMGDDCVIWPDVSILDSTLGDRVTVHRNNRVVESKIGTDVEIESYSLIKNSKINTGCKIQNNTTICNAWIFDKCSVGPFAIVEETTWIGIQNTIGAYAHVHDHTLTEPNVEIAHAEIVRSSICSGTKIKHFCYVGDVRMGKNCNIGAGVVFANYTGKEKKTTKVESDVFVGSNSTVVGECTLGAGSMIAAGSVVDRNIPPRALVIARGQNHGHVNAASEPGCVIKENRVVRTEDGWRIKRK